MYLHHRNQITGDRWHRTSHRLKHQWSPQNCEGATAVRSKLFVWCVSIGAVCNQLQTLYVIWCVFRKIMSSFHNRGKTWCITCIVYTPKLKTYSSPPITVARATVWCLYYTPLPFCRTESQMHGSPDRQMLFFLTLISLIFTWPVQV